MKKTTIEVKEFYHDKLADALESCQKSGCRTMFMSELADARVKGNAGWNQWYSTPSIRATGKTKQGNAVVVYAHVDNYFSNPANIRKAREQILINGAGIMPQDEFQKLLEQEDGKSVFVVGYDALKNSESGVISVSKALKHPQVAPFLGGRENAEKYLAAHKKAYNTDEIRVWHCDDLGDNPVGRLLFVGNYYDYDLLFGDGNLDDYGRFLGVRESDVAEGDAAKKIKAPSLEDVLKVSRRFVPDAERAEFEKQMKRLYRSRSKSP